MYHADHQNERSQVGYAAWSRSNMESRFLRTQNAAYKLDAMDGNSYWADAIKKEIDSLLRLGCFDFRAPDFKPSLEYQCWKLMMVFEVKPDGHWKAQLVAGGHMIDLRGGQLKIDCCEGHQCSIT
jgi:hypothetical protein